MKGQYDKFISLYTEIQGLFGGNPHLEGAALGSFVAFDSVRGDVIISGRRYDVATTRARGARAVRAYAIARAHACAMITLHNLTRAL